MGVRVFEQHENKQLHICSCRLNGKRGDQATIDAVKTELQELDLGEWSEDMAAAGSIYNLRDYSAAAAKVQICKPSKPVFMRMFWATKASHQFPLLATAAQKLLSAHVTTAAAERNWSAWGRTYTSLRNTLSIQTAERLIYVKANMPSEWLA